MQQRAHEQAKGRAGRVWLRAQRVTNAVQPAAPLLSATKKMMSDDATAPVIANA